MPATSDSPSTRLTFLHGFTQTHHHWHHAAQLIATGLDTPTTLAFADLPGHGLSATDASDIETTAELLPLLAGAATYVGYSMGGRTALLAALAHPELIERLVLVGATPGIEHPAARADRQAMDEERASQVETDGVEQFLTHWLAAPMFAGLPVDPRGLAHRRRNGATGLAHSLRTNGTGAQPSVWDRLDEITMPVLVMAGDRDDKFVEIGQRMAASLPQADLVVIDDAGHAAHSEQPHAFAAAVVAWLQATSPAS